MALSSKEYWRRLEEIGWLKYVPNADQKDLLARIKKALGKPDPQFAYFCLTQHSFDAEGIFEDSYTHLIDDLSSISGGSFAPKEVRESVLKRERKISYRHNRKQYTWKTLADTDYFDLDFLKMINQSLADAGVVQRFFELPTIDQCVYLVFVPIEVFQRAVDRELIPIEVDVDSLDEWEAED